MINLSAGAIVDNKYKVERLLGEGGMGVVWLCRDIVTDVPVVLKAIRSEFTHLKDYRERILAEGRALARIDHPNVVRLNAVVATDEDVCLVMQFIEGESLDARIERHRAQGEQFSIDEVLSIFKQIVSGVGAAHAEGIIHRDLKPANVLIRAKDGAIKVTDFGIAKDEAEAQAGKGKTVGIIGSVRYMAPEQCTGKKDLDKRVDVYALGILFFELLTGKVPFEAEGNFDLMSKHVYEPLPSISERRPDVPQWLAGVLNRCCAKQREDRFGSCEEVLAALNPNSQIPHRSGTIPGAPVAPQPAVRTQIPVSPMTASMPAVMQMQAPAPITAHAAAITGPNADTVSPPNRALTVGATIALSVVVGLGISYSLGWFGKSTPESTVTAKKPAANAEPPKSLAVKPAATNTKSVLAPLVGLWKSSSGREYEGVMVGEVLELRIRDVKPFLVQAYEQNEPRLLLQTMPGKTDTFRVEDRLRPNPPPGTVYDPARARATCLVPFSELNGKPLEARLQDGKLHIDMVVIEPDPSHYTVDRKIVSGCRDLATSNVSPIESVLSRP